MKSFAVLYKNEIKLSIRDMNMVIFAVCMPLVVLIILGIIYGTKPAYEGASFSFLDQSLGALCTISICAGGLMGLPIIISTSRELKILKRFKVTPVSPATLLVVYLMLYVMYSAVSLISILTTSALFWKVKIHGSVIAFLSCWLLTMISTLSIGLMVGGIAKNSKQAGVIASVLYFPMLVFSGTTLPYEVMPDGLQKAVKYLPLTQGIQLMKSVSTGTPVTQIAIPLITMLAVTVICVTISIRFFKWE